MLYGKAIRSVSSKDLGRLVHQWGRVPHVRHLEAHVVHGGQVLVDKLEFAIGRRNGTVGIGNTVFVKPGKADGGRDCR